MNQKRARCEAKRFLWHLQDARFDHEHWWKGKEDEVSIEAAVWEIIRRNPNAESVHQKRNLTGLNLLGIFLKVIKGCNHTPRGFFSWSKLTALEQAKFKKRIWKDLPSQHGYLVPPVTVLNNFRPITRYLTRDLKSKKDMKKLLAFQQPHFDRCLCDETLLAHRSGQIIVAIDTDAQDGPIEKSLKAAVAHWRGGTKPRAGEKDRTGQRLDVIAQFEREELARNQSKKHRNADLFARYRRIVGGFIVEF